MPSKIALGMIVRDEARMLSLTLPLSVPFVDGLFAVDASSNDGTPDVLCGHGACMVTRVWDNDFSGARNSVISLAENHAGGYTHLLMLDADECMIIADLRQLRLAIDDAPDLAFALPRYEFVDDYSHFNPVFYPDFQARVFPLRKGFHYKGYLHEQLLVHGVAGTAFQAGMCVPLPYVHIFHYGKTKPPAQLWVKYTNYANLMAGKPPIIEVPSGTDVPVTFSQGVRLKFLGEKPL